MASSYLRSDRKGLRTLGAFVDPKVGVTYKVAAAKLDINQQILTELALVDWIERYNADNDEVHKALKSRISFLEGSKNLSNLERALKISPVEKAIDEKQKMRDLVEVNRTEELAQLLDKDYQRPGYKSPNP